MHLWDPHFVSNHESDTIKLDAYVNLYFDMITEVKIGEMNDNNQPRSQFSKKIHSQLSKEWFSF